MAQPAPALPVFNPETSVFDEHHPPSSKLISDCVHCGFCLPTCPTYALWHEEMDSPRGRIYLMQMGLAGAATMNQKYVGHFDKCLGCMACVTACPSGVQYEKLIEATRAQIERRYRRPLAERILRRLIFALFPHPTRLRLSLLPLWLYQRTGLRWLLRRTGLLRLLPRQLQAMEALLPEVSMHALWSRLPVRIPAQGPARRRVGLLLGCVQRAFFNHVNAATARVLAAEGCEVIIPQDQGCCGALMTHAGREQEALAAARKMIDIFERAQVDTVVVNAAGCGSNMKEYAWLLRDDPRYAARARTFSAKCKDIAELLAELEPRAVRHPTSLRVAYHDSCHLQHAQSIKTQPRALLKSIPGLQVVEVSEAAICCGSAGIYNMVEPQPAQELGDRKARNVLATGAEVLVSGNPGCLLQLQQAMRRAGSVLPAMHTIEIVDASIRGVLPPHKAEGPATSEDKGEPRRSQGPPAGIQTR